MDTRVDGAFIRELLLRERNEVTDECMRDRQASHCGACALEPNIARPVRPSPLTAATAFAAVLLHAVIAVTLAGARASTHAVSITCAGD